MITGFPLSVGRRERGEILREKYEEDFTSYSALYLNEVIFVCFLIELYQDPLETVS